MLSLIFVPVVKKCIYSSIGFSYHFEVLFPLDATLSFQFTTFQRKIMLFLLYYNYQTAIVSYFVCV